MSTLPRPASDEDFATWLRTEVSDPESGFCAELIASGTARWICDPEFSDVFGLEHNDAGILIVMYERGRDFETTTALDNLIDAAGGRAAVTKRL